MPNPTVWAHIQTYHETDHTVRLRPAANLVGYALFPNGWAWSEYKALTPADSMPYEAVLLAQSPESQTEIATKQVRYAIKYRRREVERLLSRFILRREIIFHVGPDIYTHPDVRATRQLDPNRTPTKREIDKLNVEKSAFGGATLHVGREILVDAIQLIERLIEHRTKVGRPPGADWNEIERVARKIIESTGFPKTQADLERSILDSTVSDGDGSTTPRLATLHERLRELRAEYGAK